MRGIRLYVIVFFSIFSIFSPSSYALDTVLGWGKVNMQGAIIDTSCTIAVRNEDQTIDMDVISISDLVRDGQGRSKLFSIKLINCILERANNSPGWKQFQVTFDGVAAGDLFAVLGNASGIALQLTDKAGVIARPGVPLPPQDIIRGELQLDYTARLVTNTRVLKSGGYSAAIHFKLDYF